MPDLPPNILRAQELLAERGPLAPDALRAALRAGGVVLSVRLVHELPERFPSIFAVDDDGRLALAAQLAGPAVAPADEPRDDEEWWTKPDDVALISLDDVAALDIETTGLDPANDHVWQIAAQRVGTGEQLLIEVDHEGRTRDPNGRPLLPLADALETLDRFLARSAAVAGHRVAQFDLPFLAAAATRAGLSWECDLPVVDVHTMSLLVDPSLPSRTLRDLADAFAVPFERPHEADADAAVAAELVRQFAAAYDPLDPGWALVRRLLAEAGDGWAHVLPAGSVPASLDFLAPRPDPLVVRAKGTAWSSARDAVSRGFAALEAGGLHRRKGQLDMAHAVAAVLDQGGRLVVEAPTGTGKSLAYLVPAAGRAATDSRPVVVATHTKVLQRQLRADALRLREAGLLSAPFRQLQGVANYLCTREIAGAIAARDARGSEWLALAVAVRALETAENGVWDDVTDGLARRNDLAYARRRLSLRATPHTCERIHCEHVSRCPLFSRLDGVERDPGVLAVNHALVAAWVELARAGARAPGDVFGERADVSLVFDEAHNLEDSLTSAWTAQTGALDLGALVGATFGRWGPLRVARDAARRCGIDTAEIDAALAQRTILEQSIAQLGEAAASYLHEFGGSEQQATLLWGVVRGRPEFRTLAAAALQTEGGLRSLHGTLGRIGAVLSAHRKADRVDGATARLLRRADHLITGSRAEIEERVEVLGHLRHLDDHHLHVHLLGVEGGTDDDPCDRWVFQRIPIEVGERFVRGIADRSRATVLTSATLRVGESFGFVAGRLGISVDADTDGAFATLAVETPFRYDEQSAVVLTSHLALPVPSAEQEFCEDLAADQVGFLSLTGGKTLTLFAARTRMETVAELVRRRSTELLARGVEILVQGEDSVARLTTLFRARPGTVLYGLRSFWEGFDAPGETLSYLVLEKPPWPHPGDPVTAARQQAIADAGGDPFLDYAVPVTAIAFAQGFGRLIRTEDDRGVAVVADRRVQTPSRAYQLLLDTLPTSTIYYAEDRDDAWTYAISFVTGEEPDLSEALELPLDRWTDLLEELRIAPGEDPTDKLRRAARELFGIEELRDEQLELMRALLAGHDVLGFLPTGSGKSLCFQLPALLHPEQRPTVVVSPLVALIKDQVDDLRGRRGLRCVQGITARTTKAEREDAVRRLASGDLRLVYVSPERLVRDNALNVALAGRELGALVVDESHCVSAWGHDFRPEFRQVVKPLLKFERSPRMGLTATATPEVEEDLERTLALDEPVVVRRPVDRPDLRYWVRKVADERERTRELLRFIGHQGDRPGIVYASRRALTEELAWIIRQTGVTARAYHAGMVPEQREAVQDDFLVGTTQVIVATKAFGMGVNKPDIGWIVHYDLPESLEAYAQESGRAARAPDLEGDCLLLYRDSDVARRRAQAGSTKADVRLAQRLVDLLATFPRRAEAVLVDPETLAEQLGIDVDELNVLVAWLETVGVLERHQDATVRAGVEIGRREPKDPAEHRRFVELKLALKARIGVRRLFDLDALAGSLGWAPDELERQLVDWSLQSLLSFSSTQRAWRIERKRDRVDQRALERALQRWRAMERRRVDDIVRYAQARVCRRRAIAAAFGDPDVSCADGGRACDACDAAPPFWHAYPLARVPDPEELVDVELVVLQAVRWATRGRERGRVHRYSETNLKAALAGDEIVGKRPLPPALFSCPQFGAVRYVRSKGRRIDEAIEALIRREALVRDAASHKDQTYSTLELTELGRRILGER